MKKAGIITYWETDNNYGTVLQNYALQHFLKNNGVQPFLIRINFSKGKNRFDFYRKEFEEKGFFSGIQKLCAGVFRKVFRIIFRVSKKEGERQFSVFIEKNLSPTNVFTSFSELKRDCPDADFYIAGSDQIWNTYGKTDAEIGEDIRVYLLEFVPTGVKKIACAASFGSTDFDEGFKQVFKKALKEFDFVSVREKSGLDICHKLEIDDAYLQPDPTMLLSADEYRGIKSNVQVPSSSYILLYLLDNTTDFSIGKLKNFARRTGRKIIYVSGNYLQRINFFKKTYPTIEEWLGLFDHADAVVTNSFHGTVFSIIFNKMFMFLPQHGTFEKQNMRISSLLEYFGLEERVFKNRSLSSLFEPVDWKKTNMKLKEIRHESPFVEYFKRIIAC